MKYCNKLNKEGRERYVKYDRFQGVFALLLTPFSDDGKIDWAAYDSYVDWQLSSRAHGLFAVCGSSEMGYLTLDERVALAARAVSRAGSVPVFATANVQSDPNEHEQELLRIADTGVSGVVLIPPDGMGVDQERLKSYFAHMVALSPVPVFLYECPMVKPHRIDPEVYIDLVRNWGIAGIKDTTCTLEGISAKIDGAPVGIVYQANTPFMLESIHRGARGIMATTTTAAAGLVLELWRLGLEREAAAEDIHARLVFLDAILGKGYPATAKYLVALQGIRMGLHTRAGKEMNAAAAKGMETWFRTSLAR